MFKVLGRIDLGKFLFKKPLRWAFSQTFGSKTKTWFDQNIDPLIDIALMNNLLSFEMAKEQIIDSNFVDSVMEKMLNEVDIPKQYHGFAKDFIKDELRKQLDTRFNNN